MFVRRRPLLRAAVVGGGAYMAGKSVARRQEADAQAEAEQNARLSDLEAQQAPPQPQYQQPPPQPQYQQPPPDYQQAPPSAAAPSSPMIDQLNQLAALHQQGVLTDDEFAAAKAKLFGS
jgi:Short C-terminal domain